MCEPSSLAPDYKLRCHASEAMCSEAAEEGHTCLCNITDEQLGGLLEQQLGPFCQLHLRLELPGVLLLLISCPGPVPRCCRRDAAVAATCSRYTSLENAPEQSATTTAPVVCIMHTGRSAALLPVKVLHAPAALPRASAPPLLVTAGKVKRLVSGTAEAGAVCGLARKDGWA